MMEFAVRPPKGQTGETSKRPYDPHMMNSPYDPQKVKPSVRRDGTNLGAVLRSPGWTLDFEWSKMLESSISFTNVAPRAFFETTQI